MIYFVFMMGGAFGYRVPPRGWQPAGLDAAGATRRMITTRNVHLDDAHKTPQFWLIWWVLCLNVTAGIGVLGMASPMLQEMFGGTLIGQPRRFGAARPGRRRADRGDRGRLRRPALPVQHRRAFLLGVASDKIGRKATYCTFFVLGIGALRRLALGRRRSAAWRCSSPSSASSCRCMAAASRRCRPTSPTCSARSIVGAIHGRLLTAWSTAGMIGPIRSPRSREMQIAAGVPREAALRTDLYILAGFLVVGFIGNLLVRPVAARWFMRETSRSRPSGRGARTGGRLGIGRGGFSPAALLAWAVGRDPARSGASGSRSARPS